MPNDFLNKFKTPPSEYSIAPFWFLNDGLEPEHLRWQLSEMKAKHIYECVLHARKGLTVEYLSDEWFEKIGIILDEAKKNGIRVYIYDEDNWPSGYAGGRVVENNPEYAAQCLGLEKIIPVLGEPIKVKEIEGKPIVRVIAVHKNEEFFDITGKEWASPELQYEVFVFRSEECGHKPAYSDKPYVDLLNIAATQKFISVTHKEYKRRFPEHWGSTIKGFFTDEPGFYQNYIYQAVNLNTIPWTADFPEYFKEKNGYDIMPYLGAVWDDMGELSVKIRQDYFNTLTEKYNESFFKPIKDFLSADGLLSIGHLHMEEHLDNIVPMEGDFFKAMRYLDYAGIDRINRERKQITEKLGSSAMNLQGKKFCFSETYGCFGWHLTLEEMRAEADFQYVRGVNKLVPHAFFSSIEDFRKNECPPSEFYQNTFWDKFGYFSDYISRLSFALSEGKFSADTLVYYPIKSCYAAFQPLETYKIKQIDEEFIKLSLYLLDNQIDFNYLDDFSAENAEIENGKFIINGTSYSVIILPDVTVIPPKTADALKQFIKTGGRVISLSENGEIKGEAMKAEEIKSFYLQNDLLDISLQVPDSDIKYQHRSLDSGELFFIVNEGKEEKTPVITFDCSGKPSLLNPLTGAIEKLAYSKKGEKTVIPLSLCGYSSALIYFEKTGVKETVLSEFEIALPDGGIIKDTLKPWSEYGFEGYSGSIKYKTEFALENADNVILKLGEVCEIAEITVNGKKAADLIWRPYTADITDYVCSGENTLEITVTNTPSNLLTEYKKKSGLMGPVKIIIG